MLQMKWKHQTVVKQVPYTGNKQKNGYLCHMVRKHGQNGQKGLLRS